MRRHIYNIIKTTPSSILDKALSAISPFSCLGCSKVGSLLCYECQMISINPPPPRCYGCQKASSSYAICQNCKRTLKIDSISYTGPYEEIYKEIILTMKKHSSRQCFTDIAQTLALFLETAQDYDAIVPVPTTMRHVRQRGFDHTKMIALHLSRAKDLPLLCILQRTSNDYQVGKSRKERFAQMQDGVKLKEVKNLNGAKILLIDDIVTTGATMSACARVLKQAGAKRVDGVAFASGS